MKHIVYITGTLDLAGGISRVVTRKASWLAEHGYDVTMLVELEGRPLRSVFPLSPKVKLVGIESNSLKVYANKRNVMGMVKSLWQRMEESRKYNRAIKEYLTAHHADVVFSTGNNASLCRLRDGSLKVYELHFSIESQREFLRRLRPMPRMMYRMWNAMKQRQLRHWDVVVSLTHRDLELKDYRYTNAVVIPNPITIVPPTAAPDYGAKRVIAVGRYDFSQKGWDLLFRAWAIVAQAHPDWRLSLFGGYADRIPEYQRMVDEAGVTGKVMLNQPVDDIVAEYLRSSFYVMSSRYEGFPLVLPEAMACGLACVSYDCNCGPADIIRSGEDGLLVTPVGDIEALAQAICHMIDHPEEREVMGRKAKENIVRFSEERVMERWVELIENRKKS